MSTNRKRSKYIAVIDIYKDGKVLYVKGDTVDPKKLPRFDQLLRKGWIKQAGK